MATNMGAGAALHLLHLPAYGNFPRQDAVNIPTIDVQALYQASLLRAASRLQNSAREALGDLFQYILLPSSVQSSTSASTSNLTLLLHRAASEKIGQQRVVQHLRQLQRSRFDEVAESLDKRSLGPSPQEEQQRKLRSAQLTSLHNYLSTQLLDLVLHFQFGLQENWRRVTAPAYAESHARALASGSAPTEAFVEHALLEASSAAFSAASSEQAGPTAFAAPEGVSGWLKRRQGLRLIRDYRAEVIQPRLIRAGLWNLSSSSSEDTVAAPVEEKITEKGSAKSAIQQQQAAAKAAGKAAKKLAGDAFRTMKLQSKAREVLDTILPFYERNQSGPFVFGSALPTSADLYLFSLLAPVIYGGESSTNPGNGTEERWPEPYLAELLTKSPQYVPLRAAVEAVKDLIWPEGWTAEEQLVSTPSSVQKSALHERLRTWLQVNEGVQAKAEEPIAAVEEEKEESGGGATVLALASLLVRGAYENTANFFSETIAAPFRSTPRQPHRGAASSQFYSSSGSNTRAAADDPMMSTSEGREMAKTIRSRSRWWIAASAVVTVVFIFASGIISIEFVDDEENEEGLVEEEEELDEAELQRRISKELGLEDRSAEEEREHMVFATTDEQEEHGEHVDESSDEEAYTYLDDDGEGEVDYDEDDDDDKEDEE